MSISTLYSFMVIFSEHLLEPDAVLGARGTATNQGDKVPCSQAAPILVRMRQPAPYNMDCQAGACAGRKTNREAGWGVSMEGVVISDQGLRKAAQR